MNDRTGELRGVDWEFNAWGGKTEGCYPEWAEVRSCLNPCFLRLLIPCFRGSIRHELDERRFSVSALCLFELTSLLVPHGGFLSTGFASEGQGARAGRRRALPVRTGSTPFSSMA